MAFLQMPDRRRALLYCLPDYPSPAPILRCAVSPENHRPLTIIQQVVTYVKTYADVCLYGSASSGDGRRDGSYPADLGLIFDIFVGCAGYLDMNVW